MGVLVQDKPRSDRKMAKQFLGYTVLDSPATVWTDLPEYVFESVVEQLQGDRKVSADFRRVCHAWLEAHDRLVTVLRPNGVPQGARLWSKFGGVKTLSLKRSSMPSAYGVNDDATLMKALEQLTDLTSLDLTGWKRVTNEGITALAKLTGLISLDLTHCTGVTNEGVRALSPLTAMTNLNLAYCCGVTDEGVRMLAPLTATISPPRCSSKWTGGIVSSARERVLNKATRWVAYTWRSPSTRC